LYRGLNAFAVGTGKYAPVGAFPVECILTVVHINDSWGDGLGTTATHYYEQKSRKQE